MSAGIYLIIFGGVILIAFAFSLYAYKVIYAQKLQSEIQIDITEQQMHEIEDKIQKIKDENGFDDDTDIYTFAKSQNVYEGIEKPMTNSKACIESENNTDRKIVDYSIGMSKEDKIFAFAHECGHVINDDHIPNKQHKGHGKPEEEQLADYVAAALLLPRRKMENYILKSNFYGVNTKEKMKIIRMISQRHCVTVTAVIKRIKEIRALNNSRI